ncbi:MAG TPA: signal peptidase I [Candidatus Acidoferrales bacterium]|nr:signal peptidase I [Candidatus Acidoferrales bacterium]
MKADTADALADQKRKPARSTANERIWREVVSWFWVIVAFLLIEGVLVQARVIPSGSMEDTVLIGDHLIVSRFGYDAGVPFTDWHVPLWRNPKRQQIIVFRAPLPEEGYPDFIKRCIGVPGDHIKVVAGVVYVNGVRLNEPYALHGLGADTSTVENYPPSSITMLDSGVTREWAEDFSNHVVNGEVVVPPNEYFMMGDNRDNSRDSRFWGFVPRADIIGTPLIIYMSIDAPDPEEVWGPGFAVQRFETYASVFIHPGRVRWKRLFHTL